MIAHNAAAYLCIKERYPQLTPKVWKLDSLDRDDTNVFSKIMSPIISAGQLFYFAKQWHSRPVCQRNIVSDFSFLQISEGRLEVPEETEAE